MQEDKPLDEVSTKKATKGKYPYLIVGLTIVSFIIMYSYVYSTDAKGKGFKALIDFTTTLSFLVAPIIAIVNFRLMSKRYVGEATVPPMWMRVLSYLGVAFLLVFTIMKLKGDLG